MATAMKKKSNSSKDHSNEDIDAHSFLAEERRLLPSERRPLKTSGTNQVSKKSITKFNTIVNQMTPEQIDEELQKRQLSNSGDIDIQRYRLKQAHSSKSTVGSNGASKTIEQHFEFIAVVDFEATCEQGQDSNYRNEIIEFPIVLINVQEQTIVEQFQSYCRPIKRPILSKFCTDLTGIQQYQVDAAPTFPEVLHNVETWLNQRNLLSSTGKPRLAFATDGPWDFANFLRVQCQISSIPYPRWADQWINIRKEFAKFYGVRSCGITKMLAKLGLNFDGRPHSGLDDAVNIARIAITLLKDGCILSFNDGTRKTDPKSAALAKEKTGFNNSEEKEEDDDIVFQS